MLSFLLMISTAVLVSADKGHCRKYSGHLSPPWVRERIEADRTLAQTNPTQSLVRQNVQRFGFEQVAGGRPIPNHNEFYTHEIEMGQATNQDQSGRCWIFATCNVIRSMAISRGLVGADFNFSQNYLYFYGMLEKANAYLVNAMDAILEQTKHGEAPDKIEKPDFAMGLDDSRVNDGDWWSGSSVLIKKYGMVPQSAMPDTESSRNSQILINELMTALLFDVRQMVNMASRKPKNLKTSLRNYIMKARRDTWTILATHLGTPPGVDQTFSFRSPEGTKKFTPISFVKDYLQVNPDDFIVAVSNPFRPKNGYYEMPDSAIGVPEKGQESNNLRMLNVTNDRLAELVVASINKKVPVWFGADVRLGVDSETGIMHPDIFRSDDVYGFRPSASQMPLNDRLIYGTTTLEHAMVITAYDLPEGAEKVVKYKAENSWDGQQVLHMYPEWFSNYVFMVVVPKSVLSRAEKRAIARKPEMIDEDGWEIP